MTRLWVSFLSVQPHKISHRSKGAFVWGVVPAVSAQLAEARFSLELKAEGFDLVSAETERFQSKVRRDRQNGCKPGKTVVLLARMATRTQDVQLGDYYHWSEE